MYSQQLSPATTLPFPPLSPPNNRDSATTCKSNILSFPQKPNTGSYASILDSCTSQNLGQQVHAHAIKTGFQTHQFVSTKLLQMYSQLGCLDNANLLFDEMTARNSYALKAILSVNSEHGLFHFAFNMFVELLVCGVVLEFFVFPVLLKVCSGIGVIEIGRQIHGLVLKYGFFENVYVGNALIDMYGKCGNVVDAKKVLRVMPERDSVSWNSVITACAGNGMVYEALEFLEGMGFDDCERNLVSWSAVISGFVQNGHDEEAIQLLFRMQVEGVEPNAQTLASVLPACARLRKISLGKEFHGFIVRHGFTFNPFIVSGLVDLYRRCSDMESARKIFSNFSVKNSISYNTMIVGYCEIGDVSKAKELFDRMELNGIKRDLISWNSMISGYVDNFMFHEALVMFSDLLKVEGVEPDSFTLGSALTACASMLSLQQGEQIHSYAISKGLRSNTFVGGALVELYSKCHYLVAAQMAFDDIVNRDISTWNALISGYACCNEIDRIASLLQEMKEDGFEPNLYTWSSILAGHVENGHLDLTIKLFCDMQTSNLRPDIYMVGIILPACSKLATLERGKQVHAYSIRCGYDSDVYIGAALVDMYAKCGSIKHAFLSYKRISKPNLVSHNAMLTAYAMHGCGEEGIALFQKMLAIAFKPDHVTFLSVLSSCVHVGSAETGREFFDLMRFYDVEPTLKHYTSMVDLLSRSGKLEEAYELIMGMPMPPDSVLWAAFLGGCVLHGNVQLGETAAKRLINLEPGNSGNYILLANLYASAKRWSDLSRIRQLITDRGMHKTPGCSWIEDRDEVHTFLASDTTHKRTDDIHATLGNLTLHMKSGLVGLNYDTQLL